MNVCKKCIVMLVTGLAMALFAKDDEPVVCKTCNDTGRVAVTCPVCKGTRYVWRCILGKNRSYSSYARRFDEDGNLESANADDSWCGYGATYKALHTNCKNSRKRIPCPNCQNKGKSSSTGKITEPCPDCDGRGTLMKTYYLIRDTREVSMDREYICRQIERGTCSYVIQRKMTKDDLADFKIENMRCKVFEKREDAIAFIKRGEENDPDAKWYFVIRDANRLSMSDKRNALESTLSCDSDGYSNVFRRKLSDDAIKDFKALNPNCKLFRAADEFKDFVRNAKAVSSEQHSWNVEGEQPSAGVFRQVTVRTNANGRVYRRVIRTVPTDNGGASVSSDARQPSPEELKAIAEAEERHDREMFQKKFGKEGLKRINKSDL